MNTWDCLFNIQKSLHAVLLTTNLKSKFSSILDISHILRNDLLQIRFQWSIRLSIITQIRGSASGGSASRGVCIQGGPALGRGAASGEGVGQTSPSLHGILRDTVNKRAECILVKTEADCRSLRSAAHHYLTILSSKISRTSQSKIIQLVWLIDSVLLAYC